MIIGRRFNGPDGTGNGGYTAGLLADLTAGSTAAHLPAPVEVTLRLPPPLETPLRVETSDGGDRRARVYAQDRLIAEAVPAGTPGGEPVPPVSHAEAVAAATAYRGLVDHPFPRCYVCGPDRPEGDGLRIFPGPLSEGRTAAPWLVPADVAPATVWAALDCPGGWTIIGAGRPYLLGRMTAVVDSVPPPGARCVVVGALSKAEGRKAQVRTALYLAASPAADPAGADPAAADPADLGAPLAYANAVWIAI